MINHNFFHSLVLPLAADFFPPLICNFCWSHLFHMDFSFFSFCISPRQSNLHFICTSADFFPPLICNFWWNHLFHMDFPFFSFCISPRKAICILSAILEQSWTDFTSYHHAHLQHRRKFWRENDTFKPLSQYFCYLSDTWRLKIFLHSKLCDIFCSHKHTETQL